MDAQQFLSAFGHIANAPEGVTRLRALMLSLAFSGRLCARSDDTVESLIEAIEGQRAAAKVETRNQRLARERAQRATEGGYFAIPDGWRWISLSTVGHTWGQKKPSEDFYYIDVSSIDNKAGALSSVLEVVPASAAPSRARKIVKKGTLIYSTVRPYLLNVAVVDRDFDRELIASTAFAVVHPWRGIEARYLYHYLRSPHFVRYVESVQIGMAYPAISDDKFYSGLVPIPPSEEQSRIVAKVDELMALCDQLEQQQQDRRKLQNVLRQSTLQALASAQSPHELQTSWQRLQGNFGRLFGEPADVSDLRKSILDLAVSGRLSGPTESDQPASSLKDEIFAAKEAGMSTGAIARKRHVKPEELQETVLPTHWESIALDDAISSIDAGWSPACLPSARDDESKWGVLKTTAVQMLRFLPHEHKELPVSLEPRPQYQIKVGDILITRAGPKNRVGICCVVDVAPPRLMISDKLIRFHIVEDLIDPSFVALCLSAGESGRTVERLKSGMAESQMNISQDKLRSITIPLPPLEEQRRVLRKIEALMRMIDLLEEQLKTSLEASGKAATAAVATLTGITIEQYEETAVKAPQTELIAPLRLATPPDVKAQAPLATILARHQGGMAARDLWQRFGGEVDAFYAQLKTEVAHGWIAEPEVAQVREKLAAEAAEV